MWVESRELEMLRRSTIDCALPRSVLTMMTMLVILTMLTMMTYFSGAASTSRWG